MDNTGEIPKLTTARLESTTSPSPETTEMPKTRPVLPGMEELANNLNPTVNDIDKALSAKHLKLTNDEKITLSQSSKLRKDFTDIVTTNENAMALNNVVLIMLGREIKKDSILTAFEKGIDMPDAVWTELYEKMYKVLTPNKDYAKYYTIIKLEIYPNDPVEKVFKKALKIVPEGKPLGLYEEIGKITPQSAKDELQSMILETFEIEDAVECWRRTDLTDHEILEKLLDCGSFEEFNKSKPIADVT